MGRSLRERAKVSDNVGGIGRVSQGLAPGVQQGAKGLRRLQGCVRGRKGVEKRRGMLNRVRVN